MANFQTGETVADFLQKVIAYVGRPVAYLKDAGTELAKTARLSGERGVESLCIADISHMVANFFKSLFGKS